MCSGILPGIMKKTVYWGLATLLLTGAVVIPGCGSDADPTANVGGASGSAGKAAGGAGSAGKTGTAGSAGKAGTAGNAQGGSAQGGSAQGGSAPGEAGTDAGGDGPSEAGSAGDGGDAGATNSAGSGGTSGSAGAGGAAVATCGSAPYARANVAGNVLLATPTSDITVTGSLCTGTQLVIPAKTGKLFDVPNLKAIYFKATQAGSYNGLSPEYKLDKDGIVEQAFKWEPVNVLMIANTTDYTLLDPGWNTGTHAVIIVGTAKADGGTNTCANVGGVTYTVTGHNEAIVKYSGNGTSTPSDTGYATIFLNTTGTFTSPELVTIAGAKTGCAVKITGFASGGPLTNQTGNIPVGGNTVTGVVTAAIGNP